MERPSFVKTFAAALVVDIVFLFGLLFMGYSALLGLLFYTPLQLCGAIPSSFEWLEEREPGCNFWSPVARAICGSGLIFILLAVGRLFTGEPDQHNLWGILAVIYLNLWLVRFYCAGMVNGVTSLLCLVLGRDSFTRLSATSALLTSAAGLYLFREILQKPQFFESLRMIGIQSDAMVQTLFTVLFFGLNFGACLVCGTMIHWLAVKWNE